MLIVLKGVYSTLNDYSMNFCTPDNIIKILEKSPHLDLSRLVFTSSQYVIGPEHSGDNKMGYAPHTIYGISKVMLEQRLLNLYERYKKQGSDIVIIRPTNVWGGRHPKYSNMWEKLLEKKLVIIPSKEVIKSYCHISTLCSLFKNAANTENLNLSIDNLIIYGTDAPITQKKWVELQTTGLKENGLMAGFFQTPIWFLYFLSSVLELVTMILRVSNPLPFSRVKSMTYSYLVSLESPENLQFNASYDELLPIVIKDIEKRKIG